MSLPRKVNVYAESEIFSERVLAEKSGWEIDFEMSGSCADKLKRA
jgi:hypothetical protein